MKRILFAIILALLPSVAWGAWTDNLIAAWQLNEASGNAIDSHSNGITLTDINTVGAGTGLLFANARDFEQGNAEWFTVADSAHVSTGDISYTFAVWVKAETLANFPFVLTKDNAGAGSREYALYYNHSDTRWKFEVSGDGSAMVTATADNAGAASTGVWYLLIVWHDSTGNSINIQVNNGTPNSTSHSTGSFDTASAFNIGARGGGSFPWDGLIGPCYFWKRLLTTDEKTALYNGGTGFAYPFVDGAAARNAAYYYRMMMEQ